MLAVAVLSAAVVSQTAGAHAQVTEYVTSNGIQNCGPSEVTQSGGNAITTWGPCAMTTTSNVSPLAPQPDPGVFELQASNPSGSGLPCTGTNSATFSSPIGFEYRSELGKLTWSGFIPYADNMAGACVTNYAALTKPLSVTGTGFYVNMQELCEFHALGPNSPALTAGGPGEISFYVDSNAPGTGCLPTN